MFASIEFKELLEFTPEQRKEVIELAATLDQEYQTKIHKLRSEMLQRLVREKLDPAQRAKMEKVLKVKL